MRCHGASSRSDPILSSGTSGSSGRTPWRAAPCHRSRRWDPRRRRPSSSSSRSSHSRVIPRIFAFVSSPCKKNPHLLVEVTALHCAADFRRALCFVRGDEVLRGRSASSYCGRAKESRDRGRCRRSTRDCETRINRRRYVSDCRSARSCHSPPPRPCLPSIVTCARPRVSSPFLPPLCVLLLPAGEVHDTSLEQNGWSLTQDRRFSSGRPLRKIKTVRR